MELTEVIQKQMKKWNKNWPIYHSNIWTPPKKCSGCRRKTQMSKLYSGRSVNGGGSNQQIAENPSLKYITTQPQSKLDFSTLRKKMHATHIWHFERVDRTGSQGPLLHQNGHVTLISSGSCHRFKFPWFQSLQSHKLSLLF